MHTPAAGRRSPLNTYRLQLHAGFTFADAQAQLDYLAALGITDLYLSPILTAVPGSTHGYDVVDPTTISEERGGRAAFESLAAAAHERGLGVFVDIVPNHMAIPEPLWLDPALWDALREGENSRFAGWFDIEPGQPLVLPIVQLDGGDRDPTDALIAAERLTRDTFTRPGREPEAVLSLDGKPFPLAPETADLPLPDAVRAQRYSLRRWEGNHTRLTHRRFFDIVSLIGVRQEVHEVFEATHGLLLDLFRAGHIDGFRVDHPDGLADPQGYFEQLSDATGGAWVVAEKILTGDELLPPAWPVAGTTGYEASWRFDAVQLNPDAADRLAALAHRIDESEPARWADVAHQAKRFLAGTSLASDVDRLVRLAVRCLPDHSEADLEAGLREFLVALDRYRAYVRPGRTAAPEDAAVLADAAGRAAAVLPANLATTVDELRALADGTATGADPSAAAEFVIRFQQVTGALVAKGVEDTAFYRWTQLLTLCDVGSDPTRFGLTPAELHDWLGKVNAGWPATMTLGSTHDSKRSEDVRARIAAISEYPDEWADLVTSLDPVAAELPARIRNTWWQTLAGTWDTTGPVAADRLAAYLVKAGREQKLWTSWVDPDHDAEPAAAGAVPEILADPTVQQRFAGWVDLVAESVATHTLSAKLVQLTALGVADTYQGQETVRLSVTDPDNRRDVDFDDLAGQLSAGAAAGDTLAHRKLELTTTALRLRQRHPEAFVGDHARYRPLDSTTAYGWGFARGESPAAVTVATRLPRSRREAGGWAASDVLTLPEGSWLNLFTGTTHTGSFGFATGLGRWPCALLERTG